LLFGQWLFQTHDLVGDKMCLLTFEKKNKVCVTFGNNDKVPIKDKGMIGNHNPAKIENV